MKILQTQVLRGPNVWSNYRKKLIQVKIDLEEMEKFPTDKIDGFYDRITTLLPTMVEHECSEGRRGGFFERVRRGTWLGHVIEHVALELQSLAGMKTGYGRTRETQTSGVYNMVFEYTIEEAGLYASEAAFRVVDAISKGISCDVNIEIEALRQLRAEYALGPSTASIVKEAEKRGIPWKRLGNQSKIQLGYGANQKRFQATMTANTSAHAVDLAGDKDDTKRLLAKACIPVADGDFCSDIEKMQEIISDIGYPVVIKPLDGNQGKGASINITDDDTAKQAFLLAKTYSHYVLVEKYIPGSDYRLLVIDGKFIAAAKRVPAHVTGNGVSTITELIAQINKNPRRGDGHEAALTKVKLDDDSYTQLKKYGYDEKSIPEKGETVFLKSTANLSTGGTATDVTDDIHPENKFTAERIAKIVGLDICGIDVMATSISKPFRETGGVVLEVNAAPGFRMHLEPTEGKSRNVAAPVIDMLYPNGAESRIPLIAVTGTNGKTTTTRLVAHIAKSSGYTAGYTTTDGIYIGDYKIESGDTTGPLSAATILEDPMVDFAVLETARGGLLRSGLYFDQCDVGVITNIQEDHLGLNDIHTLKQLANVKAVIARSVKRDGYAVLNAGDKSCVRIAGQIDCNIAFFSKDPENETVVDHIKNGGIATICRDGNIFVVKSQYEQFLDNVSNIPLTEDGKAGFMVENVLAAAAAAFSWGFSISEIREALQSFVPGYESTPGRMNLFQSENYTVLVDYAHNPHGLLAIKEYLGNVEAKRKVGIISGVGDRRDCDIIQFAEIAASMFDHVIIRQEHDLRGRTEDEINRLIIDGLTSANPSITYNLISDEKTAIGHALRTAQEGDFIVALSDQYHDVIQVILAGIDADKSNARLPTGEHVVMR